MVAYRQGACETSNATYTRRPLQNGSWLFFDPEAMHSNRAPVLQSSPRALSSAKAWCLTLLGAGFMHKADHSPPTSADSE